MARFIAAFFVFFGLAAAGCSEQAQATATPPPSALGPAPTAIPPSPITPLPKNATPVLPPAINGKFVFAPGDGSIWIQDSPGAQPHPLVKVTTKLFSEAPVFSPDGSLVAFMRTEVTDQGPAVISIQLIGADGSNPHTLLAAPDPKSSIGWPAFSGDGKWVYYTLDSADHRHSEIDRVALTGGSTQKVLDDGRQAVVSADGKQIAFMRFNTQTFASSLWIANGEGSNPRQLLRDDTFLIIAAPHFSPDGQWILFAASGPPRHGLTGFERAPARGCEPWLLCDLVEPAYADGLPWDMWLISTDGARYRQLTRVGGDSPWPVWSHDGKYIVFFEIDGIFALDVNQGTVTQVSRNGGHGLFDWWSSG
jgi:Tol biopolymer transport system component